MNQRMFNLYSFVYSEMYLKLKKGIICIYKKTLVLLTFFKEYLYQVLYLVSRDTSFNIH